MSRWFTAWISRRVTPWLVRIYDSCVVTECHGIRIACTIDERKLSFARDITDALSLILEHDPRRLSVIRRTTGRIVARSLPTGGGSAEYRHDIRTTSIDYEPFESRIDDAYRRGFFAGLLIHEATHGRIRDFGVVTTRENRDRIERLCLTEENRFYRRIGYLREGLTEELSDRFEAARWERIWNAGRFERFRMGLRRIRNR